MLLFVHVLSLCATLWLSLFFFLLHFISRSFSSPPPSKQHLLMSVVSFIFSEVINYSFVIGFFFFF